MIQSSAIVLADHTTVGVANPMGVAAVAERGLLRELASAKRNRDILGRPVADRLEPGSFVRGVTERLFPASPTGTP